MTETEPNTAPPNRGTSELAPPYGAKHKKARLAIAGSTGGHLA